MNQRTGGKGPQTGKDKDMRRECERIGRVCVAVVLTASAACMAGDKEAADCEPGQVTVSKETTYFTEPLREDGTVDYIAALKARFGEGVTPKNNAAVLLVRAFGPGFLMDEVRGEVLERLDIPGLPEEGDYFGSSLPEDKLSSMEDWNAFLSEPRSAGEYPGIAAWVERNAGPLELLKRASERPRYFMPLVPTDELGTMMNVALPALGQIRNAARGLLARAVFRLEVGEAEAAWSNILAVHRLARLVSQGPFLIERLVGISLEDSACRSAFALAGDGKLPAGKLRRCVQDLNSLGLLPDVAPSINLGERSWLLDAIATLRRAESRPLPFNSPIPDRVRAHFSEVCCDPVLRMTNEWYDSMVAAARKPTWAERREALDEYAEAIERLRAYAGRLVADDGSAGGLRPPSDPTPQERRAYSRRVGGYLLSVLLPTMGRACEMRVACGARCRMTKLVFAAAAYKAERGAYPPTLTRLKPNDLETLPVDPFTGEPFQYERTEEGFVLYSVGPDMDDDGGSDEGDDADDIAVRVP